MMRILPGSVGFGKNGTKKEKLSGNNPEYRAPCCGVIVHTAQENAVNFGAKATDFTKSFYTFPGKVCYNDSDPWQVNYFLKKEPL